MMSAMPGLDALPLPTLIFSEAFSITWINAACGLVPGSPLALGKQLDDLFSSPEAAAAARTSLTSLEPGQQIERDIQVNTASGSKLNGILTITRCAPASVAQEQSFLAVYQDITSRNAMASIMETSFDNFIQTTNNLDDAMKKIKLQRAALHQFRKKMIKELDVARTVQKSIITRDFPQAQIFECQGLCRSSDEIGGDYLDVLELDDGNFGFLVADVSGHGVAPALITTMLRAWVHDIFPKHRHLDTFFADLNTRVYETFSDTGFYLTAFGIILNSKNGDLELCSAGHDALIRLRGKEIEDVGEESGGRVIGALPDTQYTFQTSRLEPGDILVCHTDGISECRSVDGGFYGRPRLAETVKEHAAMPLTFLLDMVMSDLDIFAAGEKAHDDQTILLLRGK